MVIRYSEKMLFRLDNRKGAYLASISQMILAMVDAARERARSEDGGEDNQDRVPILLIGKATFKASKKGKRAANPSAIVDYLKRFFPVIIVVEYLTSKLYSCCFYQLKRKTGSAGTRVLRMSNWLQSSRNVNNPLIVNKDSSAALNIFQIFLSILVHAVSHPKKDSTIIAIGEFQ